MSRIFIVDSERRDWGKRIREGRATPADVTRRYVMIVDHPQVREVIRKEFQVIPHESEQDFIFYCIARPHCRRPREFVKAIFYKLQQHALPEPLLNELEILTA